MQRSSWLVGTFAAAAALLIAVGLALGGYLAGRGVMIARLADRYVTVKGAAEIETTADLATYPLRVTITTGDLLDGKDRIDRNIGAIVEFLKAYGFAESELVRQPLDVQDLLAQGYRPEGVTPETRFILAQAVLIRSAQIGLVTKVSQEIGALVRRGIVLTGGGGPTYILTAGKLKALKPDLIRQATLAAKDAAKEFAATSGSEVGGIRRANQGVIVVLARDESPMVQEFQSVEKRVRAVATVEYLLVR